MKTSKWKKVCALGLSFALTLGLAGCNNAAGDGNKGQGGGGGNDKVQAENAQLAKQYVYCYNKLSLGNEDDDVNVAASYLSGDRLEFMSTVYNYDEWGGESQIIYLYSMKTDGTDLKKITLTMPEIEPVGDAGTGAAMPVAYSESGIILSNVSNLDTTAEGNADGNAEEEIGEWDGEVEDIYPDEENYSYDYTYYSNCCIGADQVFAFRNRNTEWFEDGEYQYVNEQAVCSWNKSGDLLWECPVDMSKYQNEEQYSYVAATVTMKDGSFGLIFSGDANGIVKIDAAGNISDLKKMNTDKDIFSQGPTFVARPDGTLLLSYYNNDWTKQMISTFDPEKETFGEEYEVPSAARMQGFYNFFAGANYDVLYSNYEGIFGFNLGDTEVVKVMDYVNSDIATYGLNNLVSINETSFIASYYDPVSYQTQLGLFTYVKPEDIKDKKTIVYAGVNIDTDCKRNIIRFNKANEEYRITLKDYGIYNTDEDYTQGYTKLNNDIIAGSVPDILLLDSAMPIDSFIAKGLLANIDEMIKNDAELSQLEFMDNVFEAYRVDGVLYRIIPKFNISTWIGKKSIVGDRSAWTMEDAKQAQNQLTGEKSLFGQGMTRDEFMYNVMSYCGSDFVDLKTGKCNFNNKLFMDLLQYARELPEQSEDSGYDEDYWNNYWENYYIQYRQNQTLLMRCDIYDLSNMKYQVRSMFDDDISYIGFPTESGSGSVIEIPASYAIYAKSSVKDGAWEFLSSMLKEDYQRNEDYQYGYQSGIPVLKKIVREQADKTMEKPYWEDENGNKNYYDDSIWISGEEVILQPFNKAEADKLFDFACSVNKSSYHDENVLKIVSEEAGSFFSGSKSAQDVADKVQNRVQLYVNENR